MGKRLGNRPLTINPHLVGMQSLVAELPNKKRLNVTHA